MHHESRPKDNVIYTENDTVKNIYFVRKGEVKLFKKVGVHQADITENLSEILENPTLGRKKPKHDSSQHHKMHMLAMVSKCHILGLEDVTLGRTSAFQTTALAHTDVDLYRIDKDLFTQVLSQTKNIWRELIHKAANLVKISGRSIRVMETTSRQINEKLSKPKEASTGEPSTVVKVLALLEERGDKYVRQQGGFASLAQSMVQDSTKLPPV